MTRKSSTILAILVLMFALDVAVRHVLTGGGDFAVVSGALDQFRGGRGFAGTVSAVLPGDSGLNASGELDLVSAGGRFFIPEGKTLVGDWTVSGGETAAGLADIVVIGDGKLYLRDRGLGKTTIGAALGLDEGAWVEMDAKALWPEIDSSKHPDAAALWNDILETATDPDYLTFMGQAMSEKADGVPNWHFLLGVTSDGVYRIGKDLAELRRGRWLSSDEDERLRALAETASPFVDLWVSKKTGKISQAVIALSLPAGEAASADALLPVIVTFRVIEYPAWQPIQAPGDFVSPQAKTDASGE